MEPTLRTTMEAARDFRIDRWRPGAAPELVATAAALLDDAAALGHLGGRRVVLGLDDDARMVRRQLGLALAGADVCLVPPRRLEELGPRLHEEAGFDLLEAEGAVLPGFSALATAATGAKAASAGAEGRLFIFTSGTTGPPKLRQYTYQALLGQAAVTRRLLGVAWGGFYPVTQFAALQVLMAALRHDAPLVLLEHRRPEDVAACIRAGRIGCLTGTPTLWRQVAAILDREGRGQAAVHQITLGGEAVTQATLDQLRAFFPEARLTHIYASTELGPVFSISDGRAGFPSAWLEHGAEPPRYQLSVHEGELHVRDRQGADAPWQGTGDLVRVEGERVYFEGRSTSVINVGGAKAIPEKIEAIIEAVPGVVLARVYGQPNPVTGQAVVAEVQMEAGQDAAALRLAITAACRSRLPAHELPRKIVMKDVGIINDKRSRQP